MSRKSVSFITLVILITLCSFSTAKAQWTPSGTAISIAADDQNQQKIVSDGSGGAIIAWQDYRNGTNYDIYAQRVDASGNVLWTTNGVAISTASGFQTSPQIISDGSGGAFITWGDNRILTNWDIYAQRVDANGNVLWTADGVAITTALNTQNGPQIVSDGSGGAIIAWHDYRSGTNFDIYAQRIDANGSVLWTADGVAVCTAANNQLTTWPVSDGSGGIITTWRDERIITDANIYAQRIDANGNVLWTADGVAVCTAAGNQTPWLPVSDGLGGAIIAWGDNRSGTNYDIYAQRIDSNGNYRWWFNGVAVCTDPNSQSNPMSVSDGAGGAIITWEDLRGPVNGDIYAQRVRTDGNVVWAVDGVPISTVPGDDDKYLFQPVSDGAGGAIIAWEDYRFISGTKSEIYAQRIDKNGNVRWETGGSLVVTSPIYQYAPEIALDGSGGAIIAWESTDIYAQRLEIHLGNWGRVEGRISSVKDVASDQGGHALVEWSASRLDVFDEQTVSHYSVWRALDPLLSPLPAADLLVETSDIQKDFQGPAYRFEHASAGDYYWEWVANTNAQYFSGYSYAVPTLNDSTAANPAMHYFQILTHTSDPYVFWVSQPDSGYSVDNLSPSTPQGLAGDYSYASGKLTLEWKPNTESDLSHYAAYRGAGVDFIPSDLNRIATSTDTIVTDLPYPPEQPYYIKLSALDIHGNESAFAVLPPESITTPTMVTGFESTWREGYVEVSWVMSDVSQALEFMIERKQGPDGAYDALIPEITLEGHNASFRDNSVTPGNTYSYRVSAKEGGAQSILFETTLSIPAFKLALYQNYPNPFRPETLISFELPGVMNVELTIFDASGRKVATLLQGRKPAGLYKVPFRADGLASGVYFYKLEAGSRTFSRKMIIMR